MKKRGGGRRRRSSLTLKCQEARGKLGRESFSEKGFTESLNENEILNSNNVCKTEQCKFQNDSGFTPLPQKERVKSKAAFTLAEVLITLGIIGIVAAMTMPTLIAKFQQKTFETAFKKQYTVLNNTIDFLQLDQGLASCYVKVVRQPNGNLVYSVDNADCPALKAGMISKLKLTPIDNNVTYTQRDKVLSDGGVAINITVNYGSILSSMKSYMLPDGAVLMFIDDNLNYYDIVCFVVDVNGEKGPNRWGYDVFWLTLSQYKNKIRLTDEYASLSEKGGSLPRNILMNKWSNDFNSVNFGVWGQ